MGVGTVRRGLLIVLVLVVPTCGRGAPASSSGVFFPTVPRGDEYPAALIEGVLEVRSDCLFISADGERWLLLWPQGYKPHSTDGRIEIVNEAGERIGREGDQVRLGGGETRPVEVGGTAEAEQWASELTGLDIPERCGDLYWIVSPF